MKKTILFICIGFGLLTCRKSERDFDKSLNSAEDELRAEAAYFDLFSVVDEAALATTGIRNFTTHLTCATITTDLLANPKSMTIDFGAANCLGTDGRNRRGKLYCTLIGNYNDSLTVSNITPLNYYVNDHKIDGSIMLTNNGRNGSSQQIINMKVVNGKINPASQEWIINWECNFLFTQTNGNLTPVHTDDEFVITGTSTAIGQHGESFSSSIQTGLLYQWSCGEVISGLNDVEPANINVRHIDYGSGTCDNKVKVNIQGYIFEIHNLY